MTFIRTKTQYFTPTTGGTVTIANANADIRVAVNPAGTIASVTFTFPSTPYNGQIVTISTTQVITAVTMGGGTILGAITTFASSHGYGSWMYWSDNASWFRAA